MSPEHVKTMNELLAHSSDVAAACASLDRACVLHYRLSNGPGGADVHWTMTFAASGVTFGLEEPPAADLVISAGWADTVRAARAARAGEPVAPTPHLEGDSGLLALIGPVFAAAQRAATVDVMFPDL